MSPDQLFQKWKKQKSDSIIRKKAFREQNTTVLILCEGDTEAYYIKGLNKSLGLVFGIEIDPLSKDPLSIVEEAQRRNNSDFDRIYCVFDRNSHESYDEALRKINSSTQINSNIKIINSVPCFEIWFLFHFIYSTKPLRICDNAIREIKGKGRLESYSKADKQIYEKTRKNISKAIKNSKKILQFHQTNKSKEFNPSTRFHELVEFLQNLQKKGKNVKR